MADTVRSNASDPGQPLSARSNASGELMDVVVVGVDGSDQVVPTDPVRGMRVEDRAVRRLLEECVVQLTMLNENFLWAFEASRNATEGT